MFKNSKYIQTIIFISLSFIFICPEYTLGGNDTVTFQSPTNDATTAGCDGVATSEFGKKRSNKTHKGIDIGRLREGWPIKASADWIVEFTGWDTTGGGNMIKIKHKDGYETAYMHLKENSFKVNTKDKKEVKAGDVIAELGNTGHSTDPHLHFEIRQNNVKQNPRGSISKCLPEPGIGGKGGPGGDHPDETYDIGDETFPIINYEGKSWIMYPQMGVFNEGFSNAASQVVFDKILCSVSLFNSSAEDMDNLLHDLKYFPALVVPTGGFFGLDTSDMLKYKLRKYVEAGGVLISFTQQQGYEFSCLPGGEVKGYGWAEDQSCWTDAAYVDTYKPCFAGQDKANLDVNVDGYFTQWPASATILLRRTKNNMPCMIMYPYGKGWVIASTLYSDWGYGHNHTGNAELKLIRDLISWAKDMNKEIPELKMNDMVKLDVNAANNTDKSADKVILTLIDSDRNIIATQTITTRILPHQKLTIPNSQLSTLNSISLNSLGIWWIDYELQDNAGNTIQEQMEGERFTVSKHLLGGNRLEGYKIWAVSPEYIQSGEMATFTVFVRNDTDSDLVNGNIGVGVHEEKASGGRWWAYVGTITDVSIPAHSQGSFSFTRRMDISASTYFGLFPAGRRCDDREFLRGAMAQCEKGVWMVKPSVRNMVISDNIYNHGDTMCGTITIANQSPIGYTLNLNPRIKGLGNPVDYSVWLPPNSTTAFPINISIPATATTGTYIMAVGMDDNPLALSTFQIIETKAWIQGQNYTSNDAIQIHLRNFSPIEKSLKYEIRLIDMNNVCARNNKGTIGLMGNGEGSILLPLEQIISGEYVLKTTINGYEAINQRVNVSGVSASMTITTDNGFYLPAQTITTTSRINNTGAAIIDGKLKIQVCRRNAVQLKNQRVRFEINPKGVVDWASIGDGENLLKECKIAIKFSHPSCGKQIKWLDEFKVIGRRQIDNYYEVTSFFPIDSGSSTSGSGLKVISHYLLYEDKSYLDGWYRIKTEGDISLLDVTVYPYMETLITSVGNVIREFPTISKWEMINDSNRNNYISRFWPEEMVWGWGVPCDAFSIGSDTRIGIGFVSHDNPESGPQFASRLFAAQASGHSNWATGNAEEIKQDIMSGGGLSSSSSANAIGVRYSCSLNKFSLLDLSFRLEARANGSQSVAEFGTNDVIIYEKELPINLNGWNTIDTMVEIPKVPSTGKYYITSELLSKTGQSICNSTTSFEVVDEDMSVSIRLPKDNYRGSEQIPITVMVRNNSMAQERQLVLRIAKGTETVFVSPAFDLQPEAMATITTTIIADKSCLLRAIVGSFTDACEVVVGEPMVAVGIAAPEMVDDGTHSFTVRMENKGKAAVLIKGEWSVGSVGGKIGEVSPLVLEPGGVKLFTQEFRISRDEMILVVLTNIGTYTLPVRYCPCADFVITDVITEPVFYSGKKGTVSVRIKNNGTRVGKITARLKLLDVADEEKQVWLMSDEVGTLSFGVGFDDDIEAGTYTGRIELLIDDTVIGAADVRFVLYGIRIDVAAGLDKEAYAEGDMATLTLTVTNLSDASLGTLSLSARVKFNDYCNTATFTLPASQCSLLTFNLPIHHSGQKLSYGIYSKDNRSIWLDGVYIRQAGTLTIIPDRQVYNQGGTVTLTIILQEAGTVSLTTPVEPAAGTIVFSEAGNKTFAFHLPTQMLSGSYLINAEFGTQNAECNIDVRGIETVIKEASLNRKGYLLNEPFNIRLSVDIKEGFDGVVRAWIVDDKGDMVNVYEQNKVFTSGICAYEISGTTTTAKSQSLVYGIYLGTDTMVASGRKCIGIYNIPCALGKTIEKDGLRVDILPDGLDKDALFDFCRAANYPSPPRDIQPIDVFELVIYTDNVNMRKPITASYGLDGISDRIIKDSIKAYYINEGDWVEVAEQRIDTRQLAFSLPHLSLVGIGGRVIKPLNEIIAYPNPAKDRITLGDSLPATISVRIFNIAGEMIYEYKGVSENGKWSWLLQNKSDERVSSGIYFFVLTTPEGETKTGKIGVIK
ncbi:MAG: peptidoglycan DD-metalloendopeptidase family protein [bacterium]